MLKNKYYFSLLFLQCKPMFRAEYHQSCAINLRQAAGRVGTAVGRTSAPFEPLPIKA